jgi:alkenylglycerophosphocholine/alkenylglycerophosphoethanolamine hydrolase
LGLLLFTIVVSVAYYSLLLLHLEPNMVQPVGAYSLVLTTMLWRGMAQGGSASWGALLFAFSDGVLAWDNFAQPLLYARLLTMTTYYAAQVLIALSALRSPGLKMH